jgi:hypothetical protein
MVLALRGAPRRRILGGAGGLAGGAGVVGRQIGGRCLLNVSRVRILVLPRLFVCARCFAGFLWVKLDGWFEDLEEDEDEEGRIDPRSGAVRRIGS